MGFSAGRLQNREMRILVQLARKGMHTFLLIFMLLGMSLPSFANDGVVLLHGLCRGSACMEKMEKALSRAGFVVENVDYPSRSADIARLSELVITNALSSPKLEGCSKIHFVTHSLGGILVRSYFKRHACDRLGRVVMLGPPNQGSEVVDQIGSWWVFRKINGPAGSELGTDPLSTPNRLGPVEFELGVIAGDRSINWINSLMIQGKDDGKVSVERTKVPGMKEHVTIHATHPYLMKNRHAIEYTVRFLKEGALVDRPALLGVARSGT
jgi:triacylglycerol lipase